jgi:hypothetical protein
VADESQGGHRETWPSVRPLGHTTNVCSIPDSSSDRPVPLELLEQQICSLAADIAAATCRWLELVAEFDARGGWAEWGVHSCAHWLSWRCGIGLTAAREHTRVARTLAGLPLVTDRFSSGQLTYSKVRAITRVAQPETEAHLVEIAQYATGAQLDRLVQGYAGVIRRTREAAQSAEEKQHLNWHWTDDGMLRVEGCLTAEDGTRLLAALRAAESGDCSVPVGERRAAALVQLASGDTTPTAEVIVHVDVETLAAEQIVDRCHIEDGPPIAPETMRRLGCDGALVTIVERDGQPLSVGRRTRAINPALRRALNSRDHGCRFPGCTNERFLHAHHIEHWVNGGKTELGNLIHLCSHHHRLVHEGGYGVELDATGEPRFSTAHGWEIPTVGNPAAATGTPLPWQNEQAGITVGADTCRPWTPGDSLDYGIAVEGLARRWLPPPPV